MDWMIEGLECGPEYFRDFQIHDVLVEFDGPRLFSAETTICTALFMQVDENDSHMRFIVVSADERLVSALKTGMLTVRGAFDQPLLWVVETDLNYSPCRAWRSALVALPESILPEPGLMLWPHLQPVFTLRAIGEGLSAGKVPASVIRLVVDGASTALRKAASYTHNEPSRQGRAKNVLKRLYDLPAQHFAYNSFEVAFKRPDEDQETLLPENEADEMQQIGEALRIAISTSLAGDEEGKALKALDLTLLEVLEKLVPPASGIVTAFEVGGSLLGRQGKCYTLDRQVSNKVRHALHAVRYKEEQITTLKGVVAEMDKGNLSFTLRQTSDQKDHICMFQADIFDEVMEAFYSEYSVTISGRETLKNGNIEVSIFNAEINQSLQ